MSGIDYADLPMYPGALADAVGYTDSDLEANRAGQLSPVQHASLVRLDRSRIAFVGLCIVAALASVFVAVSFGFASFRALKGWVLGLFFVLAAAIGIASAANLWRDLRAGVVTSVEGFVSSTVKQSGSRQEYFWVVDDQRFSVNGDMYTVLEPGRYRLYILPRSRRIMSIEVLPSAATARDSRSLRT